jgi:hypothetical protein
VFAQYAAPPSGEQSVWPCVHVDWHCPPLQTCCAPHVTPHAPQFWLSALVFAQYGRPPSGVHSVLVPASPPAHEAEQAPSLQTSPAPQVIPQPPQFALSVLVLAQ